MNIAVVGLGKIGLPLAAHFAESGHTVVGVDINQATVDQVNEGVTPFPGEAHLAEYLARLVSCGQLSATTSYADAIPHSDVVVVVVPLFVDDADQPDFSSMDSATDSIAEHLKTDTLVLYETTLPVGTTRTRWKPRLEAGSGLTEGIHFHLAFSPERVLTGRVFEDLRKYPKLVGGLSAAGAAAAVDFYRNVLRFDDRPDLSRANGVWDLGSAEAAEMAKLAETTYRDVNIGLANQFAVFSESVGVDVYEVIQAANSQPYSHIHQPGIAVGGHCIPVYPRLYLHRDPNATIVIAARHANESMPEHAATVLEAEFGDLDGMSIVVFGAAYRGGVKETAFSGVFAVVAALQRRGATASVHDYLYSPEELRTLGFEPWTFGDHADAAIIQNDQEEYAQLSKLTLPTVRAIFDGRNILDESAFLPMVVKTLGKP